MMKYLIIVITSICLFILIIVGVFEVLLHINISQICDAGSLKDVTIDKINKLFSILNSNTTNVILTVVSTLVISSSMFFLNKSNELYEKNIKETKEFKEEITANQKKMYDKYERILLILNLCNKIDSVALSNMSKEEKAKEFTSSFLDFLNVMTEVEVENLLHIRFTSKLTKLKREFISFDELKERINDSLKLVKKKKDCP